MQFLDTFLREELFDFVETIVHSIDTPPPSPTPNGVTLTITPDPDAPPKSHPNTVYLAQKFLGQVAAFGPGAPYPDDLHVRFHNAISNFPAVARLSSAQLKAFDQDYSALTRERAVAFYATQQSGALLELEGVRSKLRTAQAQHDLHATNHSTSQLANAQQEFDAQRVLALSSTKLLARCLEGRE